MSERRRDVVKSRRWLLVGPYLLVVLTAFAGFMVLEHDRDHACEQRQSDRLVLRQVVDIATTPSSGALDLTKIEGFDQLDPVFQNWIRNLSAKLSTTPPPEVKSLHDRLIELLPPITC